MFCMGICAFASISEKNLGPTTTELSLMEPLAVREDRKDKPRSNARDRTPPLRSVIRPCTV